MLPGAVVTGTPTGELQGSHDPSGVVFTVLAALSGMEREYIRDRTLGGKAALEAAHGENLELRRRLGERRPAATQGEG